MRHQLQLSSFFALCAALSAQEAGGTPREVLGLGWKWELAPTKLRDGSDPKAATPKAWAEYGESAITPSGYVSLVLTAAGHPVLTHVRMAVPDLRGTAAPDYRAVLLTAGGEKLWPLMSMGTSRGKIEETRYVFPVAKDPGAIASYALGLLDLEGKRERSQAGAARSKQLGASVLPLPLVGEKLEFEVPTLAGERFKSKDHLGKVIVVDSWATWCGPCMKKMPELAKLDQELAGRGLVIVGINFDQTEEKLRAAIEKNGLTWPQVFAKDAAKGDEQLWSDAAGIEGLPRILIVDRKGILRYDVRPQQLGELVRALVEEDAGAK